MSDDNPVILDAEHTATHLGLSKSTLAKKRLKGDGPPYVKLGRRVGYIKSDLDEWVMSKRFRSTAEYETVGIAEHNKSEPVRDFVDGDE